MEEMPNKAYKIRKELCSESLQICDESFALVIWANILSHIFYKNPKNTQHNFRFAVTIIIFFLWI